MTTKIVILILWCCVDLELEYNKDIVLEGCHTIHNVDTFKTSGYRQSSQQIRAMRSCTIQAGGQEQCEPVYCSEGIVGRCAAGMGGVVRSNAKLRGGGRGRTEAN
jgi:hypothetical protein